MALDKPALAQGERDPFKIVFILRWLLEHFAPSDSPVLTGDPKSVTPPPGDNDTSIATTAFVAAAVAAVPPPVYNAYTPTITVGSGTLASFTATGRFFQLGKFVHCHIKISIVSNGTAGAGIFATLPVTAASADAHGCGREDQLTGTMLEAKLSDTTSVYIANYNNAYAGGDGLTLGISICYEAA